jgi:membrane protease subunit HflK
MLLLTGDQSLIEVAATVQYRISDVRAHRFGLAEPEKVLKSLAEGVIREAVAGRPLLANGEAAANELLTGGRGPLEAIVRQRLQEEADRLSLGVEILPRGVCLLDVHPPRDVVAAFRAVSSAFKEKERMKNEADAYHRETLINAAGEAAWRALAGSNAEVNAQIWSALRTDLAGEAAAEMNAAQAFAVEQRATAEGDAAQFLAKQAAQSQEPRLAQWRLYHDTIAASLPGKRKMILGPPGAGRRHLWLGLPKETPPQFVPLAEPDLREPEE